MKKLKDVFEKENLKNKMKGEVPEFAIIPEDDLGVISYAACNKKVLADLKKYFGGNIVGERHERMTSYYIIRKPKKKGFSGGK